MQKFLNTSLARITLHVLFWIFYLGMEISVYGYSSKNYLNTLYGYLYALPAFMLSTYFTIYVLFPYFLFKRRFVLFFIFLVISAFIFTLFYRVIQSQIIYPKYYPSFMSNFSFFSIGFYGTLIGLYKVVGLGSALKLLRYWYHNQQVQQRLINQNIQSEIALLRTQINPHFLFNTLNNIDSLIHTSPNKASKSLVRLANIMRYMLYDSNEELVPIEKEIDYLKSFINLQLLRMRNQNYVDLIIEGDYSGKQIAPMLLVPFVENAFKHGDKKVTVGIIIKLVLKGDKLEFWVTNFIPSDYEKQKDKTGGIGLTNVKRRLELMYNDNYVLDIWEDKDLKQFLVKLEVQIQKQEDV